jgi:hypothetical protein
MKSKLEALSSRLLQHHHIIHEGIGADDRVTHGEAINLFFNLTRTVRVSARSPQCESGPFLTSAFAVFPYHSTLHLWSPRNCSVSPGSRADLARPFYKLLFVIPGQRKMALVFAL